MKTFIKKNFFILLIIVFLGAVSFILAGRLQKYENPIMGTYEMKGQTIGDSEYLVLGRDDNFYIYKQFDGIDRGKYREVYKNAYLLDGDKLEDMYVIKGVIDNKEVVYLTYGKEKLKVYEKISDVESFINYDPKKDYEAK